MKILSGKSNRKRRVLLITVTALLLVVCIFGGVYAKYAVENKKEGTVTAAEFYFESDLLKENGASYNLTAGTKSISFELYNHADSLRFSEVDINYSVKTSGGTLENGSGELSKGSATFSTVKLSDLENGTTYTVTATGTGGYEKTLSATFTVLQEDGKLYKCVDASAEEYVLLTVWTGNLSGNVTITIPTGLIPDRTDPDLTTVTGSFTKDFGVYTSRQYRFFKTEKYDVSKVFSVKIGETEATDALPTA